MVMVVVMVVVLVAVMVVVVVVAVARKGFVSIGRIPFRAVVLRWCRTAPHRTAINCPRNCGNIKVSSITYIIAYDIDITAILTRRVSRIRQRRRGYRR